MPRTARPDTLDLTTTDSIVVDTEDKWVVAWEIDADDGTSADYAVDVSEDGENWYNATQTYTSTDRVSDGANTPERYVRIRVATTDTGSADVLIAAAR